LLVAPHPPAHRLLHPFPTRRSSDLRVLVDGGEAERAPVHGGEPFGDVLLLVEVAAGVLARPLQQHLLEGADAAAHRREAPVEVEDLLIVEGAGPRGVLREVGQLRGLHRDGVLRRRRLLRGAAPRGVRAALQVFHASGHVPCSSCSMPVASRVVDRTGSPGRRCRTSPTSTATCSPPPRSTTSRPRASIARAVPCSEGGCSPPAPRSPRGSTRTARPSVRHVIV